MKQLRFILIAVIALGAFLPAFGQLRLSGTLSSTGYFFDTPTVEQGNFYQAVNLRATPAANTASYLNTYFQVAKLGDADWTERVYNLYGNLSTLDRRFQARIGRQFLYAGVMNGTMDGILFSGTPTENLSVKVFAGLETRFDRQMELAGSDSTAVGAYASYRFPWDFKVDVSYFNRQRSNATIWEQLGFGVNGNLGADLFYLAEYDQNLETGEAQGQRYRLTYYLGPLAFNGEYAKQRPRIYQTSFFQIFQLEAYEQYRGGLTYTWNDYQVGANYIFTDTEFDQSNEITLNVGNRWGYLGFVFQEGFAGDNIGVYGDIRYAILPELTLKFYSGYYNYERQTTNISQDATSFSGGFIYTPWRFLALHAELQESINSFYDNDVRGLLRAEYTFRR